MVVVIVVAKMFLILLLNYHPKYHHHKWGILFFFLLFVIIIMATSGYRVHHAQWLASWLASWLAGWLDDWLAGWQCRLNLAIIYLRVAVYCSFMIMFMTVIIIIFTLFFFVCLCIYCEYISKANDRYASHHNFAPKMYFEMKILTVYAAGRILIVPPYACYNFYFFCNAYCYRFSNILKNIKKIFFK